MSWPYPIFVDLTGKRCLVIGHGVECVQKIEALLEAGADVSWVSPEGPPEATGLAEAGRVEWRRNDPEPSDLDGCFLVIATGPDRTHNAWIYAEAESRNILVNCLDDPPHCRFAFASTLRRGDLAIAIFTNGKSPALSVRLRQRFERELGPEYGAFVDLAGRYRDEIAERVPDFSRRRRLWYDLVDSPAIDFLREEDRRAAEQVFEDLIEQSALLTPAQEGEIHEHAHHG